jgi:prespore-specific regulator
LQNAQKWVTRSDAWTLADDERLADLVLHHIRTGSTQLKAFEDAGNELGRTSAACGYRWNGVLRKDRKSEIEAAKQARKVAQKASSVTTRSAEYDSSAVTVTSAESMKEVIQFLQTYDEQYQSLRGRVQELEAEKSSLAQRIAELEQPSTPTVDATSVTPEQLEEDSRTLFAIMERARKLLDPGTPKIQSE